MHRSKMLASGRIEPIGMAGEGNASRKSLSTTKHKRDGRPASPKQPDRGHLQPVDRSTTAVERPNDIRAFMGRAARLRRSIDEANCKTGSGAWLDCHLGEEAFNFDT